jgi:hypothetical protein
MANRSATNVSREARGEAGRERAGMADPRSLQMRGDRRQGETKKPAGGSSRFLSEHDLGCGKLRRTVNEGQASTQQSFARVIATALSVVLASAIASCSGEPGGPGGPGGPYGDCFPMTPICGEPCGPCGCFPCFEGTEPFCAQDAVYQCVESRCRELVETCPDPDACVAGRCASSVEDCELVRTTYEAHLSPSRGGSIVAVIRAGSTTLAPGVYGPGCASNCQVVHGDCSAGLDTCWLVGHRTAEIDRLARLYQRLGCPPLTEDCQCPPVTTPIACEWGTDPNEPTNACVVES